MTPHTNVGLLCLNYVLLGGIVACCFAHLAFQVCAPPFCAFFDAMHSNPRKGVGPLPAVVEWQAKHGKPAQVPKLKGACYQCIRTRNLIIISPERCTYNSTTAHNTYQLPFNRFKQPCLVASERAA